MASFTGYTAVRRLSRHFLPVPSIPASTDHLTCLHRVLCPSFNGKWPLSTKAPTEFTGPNAYELLGVSETASFSEIKASFRKLAKETHPDLARTQSDSSASKRFIDILAAYEILSDPERKAHYDQYLVSQRTYVHKQVRQRQGSVIYKYESNKLMESEMEVVEWLKWYRFAIKDIVSDKREVVGSGYFDELERDFRSAIHAAFYGPEIESVDLLPECFEAEERSVPCTPDILHLVSGRDLFGMVLVANRGKISSFEYGPLCSIKTTSGEVDWTVAPNGPCQQQTRKGDYFESDTYKDLELHICGRLVAMASRVRPNHNTNQAQNEDTDDLIHVYLIPPEHAPCGQRLPRILLGTIKGMGTSPDEGSCDVYDHNGVQTHVIMKHRTLLVKHMHWYHIGDEVSVCECRCSRARLPPSKFWLFEPRCGMHDIGGWYVETFGRDKKGRTIPFQRHWDGLDANFHFDKKLHPAMYLLSLAYRTLDIEDARLRKRSIMDIVASEMLRVVRWCRTRVLRA